MTAPTNFDQYQEFTQALAAYNEDVFLNAVNHESADEPFLSQVMLPWMYPVLALSEEAGEVAGKAAKFVRKTNTGVSPEMLGTLRTDVAKELGDVLYNVSEAARQFGFTLQEIVNINYDKLKDRLDRGVLVGEGDNR